jgi:hypothetical protein
MEVGENRVRVFYSTEKREGEKERYIQEASAPAAAPCIRPVTCLRHMYTSNISCCMCTCIVSLTAQVRLICSWCMKTCLRRAAHISAEQLISVQTDMQTDKRYGDEYGCEYGRQVCIYAGLLASRDQSINKSQQHPK